MTENKLLQKSKNSKLKNNSEYTCPKHGNIKDAVFIVGVGINDNNEHGFAHFYCMYCFDEFLQTNISQVRLKEEKEI